MAELKNTKFKQAIVKFLINNCASEFNSSLFKPIQVIFLNYDICYTYRKVVHDIKREISEKFTCKKS